MSLDREGRRMTTPVSYFPPDDPAARCLPARPEPIMIRPAETALIVVDMQNAYASPGGYLDLAGFDIAGAAPGDREDRAGGRGRARRRHAGDLLPERLGPRLCRGGRAGLAQLAQVQRAEDHARAARAAGQAAGQGRLGLRAGRGAAAAAGRHRRQKPRYSAFFNTSLDSLLRARGIRSLVFTGIATNVCVESTLRDGFFLEYFGVVLDDATHQAGPGFIQEASLYNVEKFFGWVSSVDEFCNALQANINPDACTEGRDLMPMKAIFPPGAGKTLAPYSPGALADGVVYVSGTLALDKDNNVVHVGDAAKQTEYVLETIKSVIETAGGTMADVTFNHIFLNDWADYAAVNGVYAQVFPGDKPARYCIQCGLVKPDALVEIATIAHIGKNVTFFDVHDGRAARTRETVLLSAGLGGAAGYWAPQLAALRQRYRVVTYDQAGTGRNRATCRTITASPPWPTRRWPCSTRAARPTAHFVGHALGGLVGLELALRQPDRLRSLTVVNGWAAAHAHTGAASTCGSRC